VMQAVLPTRDGPPLARARMMRPIHRRVFSSSSFEDQAFERIR